MASTYMTITGSGSDYPNDELLKSFCSGLSMAERLGLMQMMARLTSFLVIPTSGKESSTESTKSTKDSTSGTLSWSLELSVPEYGKGRRVASISIRSTETNGVSTFGLEQLSSTTRYRV